MSEPDFTPSTTNPVPKSISSSGWESQLRLERRQVKPARSDPASSKPTGVVKDSSQEEKSNTEDLVAPDLPRAQKHPLDELLSIFLSDDQQESSKSSPALVGQAMDLLCLQATQRPEADSSEVNTEQEIWVEVDDD